MIGVRSVYPVLILLVAMSAYSGELLVRGVHRCGTGNQCSPGRMRDTVPLAQPLAFRALGSNAAGIHTCAPTCCAQTDLISILSRMQAVVKPTLVCQGDQWSF